jgi:hypothetical protein
MPLLGKDGSVVGVVGVSRDLRLPDLTTEDFSCRSVRPMRNSRGLRTCPCTSWIGACVGYSD